MNKPAKKSSEFINDPQRCEICATILTLYPHDFAECPHCGRKVCRPCWGEVWGGKSFSSESCSHSNVNTRLGTSTTGGHQGIQWDWRKALFVGVLGIVAVSIFFFILNLFIF